MLPLDAPFTAAFAMILAAAAHAVGWPVARGGSQRIVDAMADEVRSLGGEIRTGVRVGSMDELPEAGAYLFDTSPGGMAAIAGDRLPEGYRAKLGGYRQGPGAFKLDLAIDGPIPWTAEECRRAGTVHLGGTFEEIAEAERAVADGEHPERPFVLLAQQSLFDDSRAPEGKHTVWAYCHVPNGSDVDMTSAVEAQIERFAPGFRDLVIARHVMAPAALERYNANYVGGDISGGAHRGVQLFARPVASLTPYATPAEGIYLCSSSTPPGAGVHGMCGFLAAEAALRKLR
jgi:phytoene dehydrogenase-like protein